LLSVRSSSALRPYWASRRFASSELKPFLEELAAWNAEAIFAAESPVGGCDGPSAVLLSATVSGIGRSASRQVEPSNSRLANGDQRLFAKTRAFHIHLMVPLDLHQNTNEPRW
jgi:hypothetical protein